MSKLEEVILEWWKPVVIVILAATLLFFNAASNSATQKRLEDVATQTHTALCALNDDIERRVTVSLEFLEKHPQGIQGISREDIKRSLDSQRSTLRALEVLDC